MGCSGLERKRRLLSVAQLAQQPDEIAGARGPRACRPAILIALVVVLLASGCGGEAGERSGPFKAIEQDEPTATQPARAAAAPRWERVVTLRGSGDARRGVGIEPQAIQWRVRWRCSKGRFELSRTPAPDEARPLVSKRCPNEGKAVASDTGELQLAVQTEGRWEVVVEQQVTDPLDEPLLPKMEAEGAEVVTRGRFYDVDRRGRGEAVVHELPSGRLALRLEGFATSPNTDLFVWLSRAQRPRTTREALGAERFELALLKSTIGDQNYLLHKVLTADPIRSIVIWYRPTGIVYTAASLKR